MYFFTVTSMYSQVIISCLVQQWISRNVSTGDCTDIAGILNDGKEKSSHMNMLGGLIIVTCQEQICERVSLYEKKKKTALTNCG